LKYAESHPDTLIVVTADHARTSQVVPVPGNEPLGRPGTLSTLLTNGVRSLMTVNYATRPHGQSQDHTGSQVRIAAQGPQGANVTGVTNQTDLFHTLASALGIEWRTASTGSNGNAATSPVEAAVRRVSSGTFEVFLSPLLGGGFYDVAMAIEDSDHGQVATPPTVFNLATSETATAVALQTARELVADRGAALVVLVPGPGSPETHSWTVNADPGDVKCERWSSIHTDADGSCSHINLDHPPPGRPAEG